MPEQAKFSVAFSLQSLILSLSDLGFTGSIIALVGGRVADKKVVGSYIQTARRLRNYLFVFSCAITLFILPFIVKEQKWSYAELAVIIAPVLLAVFWQADCSLYDSTLVMHQKMKDLYKSQVSVAAIKLSSNYLLYIAGYIGAFTTLLLNAGALLVNGKYFKKKAAPFIEMPADKSRETFEEMVNYLKPLFPSLIFNAFYGQIQIFLISFFGKTSNIAEIAALGKLSQMFLFLGSINGMIIAPFIARSVEKELLKKYFLILSMALFIAIAIYLFSLVLPGFFLFLLGPQYYHLESELSIMILSACLSYVGGVMWTMHSARKWIFWWATWSYMICVIISQIIGISIFDISTTHGVLANSTLTIGSVLLVHIITAFLGFREHRNKDVFKAFSTIR